MNAPLTVDEILVRLTRLMRLTALAFVLSSFVGLGAAVIALLNIGNFWLWLGVAFVGWVGAIACSGIGCVAAIKTAVVLRCTSQSDALRGPGQGRGKPA